MEMQYFVEPGTDEEEYEKWLQNRLEWHKSIGLREEYLLIAPHPEDKLAHYARAAADVQYKFPIGWQAGEGVHSRTDFDMRQHQEVSGNELVYDDQNNQNSYNIYVVAASECV